MNKLWVISVIAVCAGCTFLERAFPFLLFRGKTVPEPVSTLGKLLPMAIITTAVTVILHLWKGSTMLSIAGGTVCCMLLTQAVF